VTVTVSPTAAVSSENVTTTVSPAADATFPVSAVPSESVTVTESPAAADPVLVRSTAISPSAEIVIRTGLLSLSVSTESPVDILISLMRPDTTALTVSSVVSSSIAESWLSIESIDD
jgi:hypothetical protein